MKDEKIIARIVRNASDEVIIRTFNYWNVDVVDMRWYSNGNPTKKGLRVNKDEVVILNKALKKILGDNNGDNKFNEDESEG